VSCQHQLDGGTLQKNQAEVKETVILSLRENEKERERERDTPAVLNQHFLRSALEIPK